MVLVIDLPIVMAAFATDDKIILRYIVVIDVTVLTYRQRITVGQFNLVRASTATVLVIRVLVSIY